MSETAIIDVEQEFCASIRASRISRVAVSNFRTYERADIHFHKTNTVVFGENGVGKTNLLEAISLLGPGRGLRRARMADLARLGAANCWAVSAELHTRDGDEFRLGVGVEEHRPMRRICKVDGKSVSGPSALAQYLRFLWLTPAQDRLFMEGAAERRKFLDRMALAHAPEHAKQSVDYERAMRQRQAILDEGDRYDNRLDYLERLMVSNAVAIAASRCDMVNRLSSSGISQDSPAFPAAEYAIDGTVEALLAEAPLDEVEDRFTEMLAGNRGIDARAGRTLIGPHRSDLIVTHSAQQMPARLCSTGEQKALLIGMVLSAAKALTPTLGNETALILLLDDVVAHLDARRRDALFEIIDGLSIQSIITGAEARLFDICDASIGKIEIAGGVPDYVN